MEQAYQAAAPKLTTIQKIKRLVARSWKSLKMILHGWMYKVAFALGLGWHLNVFIHKLGLYPKYNMSGRCQWCGEVH